MGRIRLYPTIIIQAAISNGTSWQDAIADAWQEMPEKAKQAAKNLITSVVVVDPNDTRLALGYTQGSRAALVGNDLILSCKEDVGEMWHEIGHAIVDKGLTPEERKIVSTFYKSSGSQRAPEEQIAEDFYFTIKGESSSPFWRWWFDKRDEEKVMMSEAGKKIAETKAVSVDPLQLVEAVLDIFAEEWLYEHGGEEQIWLYGIAKEALGEAQKESRFSYEDRSAPHQYYYPEDLMDPGARSRNQPLKEPLKVERPDVTMRGTYATPPVV